MHYDFMGLYEKSVVQNECKSRVVPHI